MYDQYYCTAKLSFTMKGQIKSFPDKKKLKEFTKPVLYEMLRVSLKRRKTKDKR